MASERWDPFREMVSLRDAFNTLLQESFVRPDSLPAGSAPLALPLDIAETAEAFVVRASLPGVRPEDVQVTVHGDTLSIQAEVKAAEEKQGETWHPTPSTL
jgi:HSP20 family protein